MGLMPSPGGHFKVMALSGDKNELATKANPPTVSLFR